MDSPSLVIFHIFPVIPSTSLYGEVALSLPSVVVSTKVYRFGLVILYRRIAAKIATTPSLNCVLVILREIRRQCKSDANVYARSRTPTVEQGMHIGGMRRCDLMRIPL